METSYIYHRPRRLDTCHTKILEYEREIMVGPVDDPGITARCPDCDCVMMYRGIGRLRSGKLVHYFECVHPPREVHSVSILIAE
jgi:hypothetical protein